MLLFYQFPAICVYSRIQPPYKRTFRQRMNNRLGYDNVLACFNPGKFLLVKQSAGGIKNPYCCHIIFGWGHKVGIMTYRIGIYFHNRFLPRLCRIVNGGDKIILPDLQARRPVRNVQQAFISKKMNGSARCNIFFYREKHLFYKS